MKLFKVKSDGNGLVQIDLEPFDQEAKMENWVEDNPSELLGVADETLLTIGRQVGTAYGTMDVLCLDVDMNPVVVELKKDRAPRDVIAQALEYTAWIADQSYDHIARLAAEYLKKPLPDAYLDTFRDDIALGETGGEEIMPPDDAALAERYGHSHLRVFIVAGKIPERTQAVARFLRGYGLDVVCMEVQRSLSEDVQVFGVDTVVGGERKYATATAESSFDDILAEADRIGRKDLLIHLREGTTKLPHIREKITGRLSYRVRIPQSRRRQVIFSYAPLFPDGIFCQFYIQNLEPSGINLEQVWLSFTSRFDLFKGDPSNAICLLTSFQEVDAWLQFIRELWSQIFDDLD